MRSRFILTFIAAVAAAGAAWAQAPESSLSPESNLSSARHHDDDSRRARAVYTQSNAAEGNEILVFSRDSHGALHLAHRAATRGLGTGAGLGSQGALALSRDGRYLYAVNAGSDTISAFVLFRSRLWLIDRIASGGDLPISLALHDDVLYVLNAGSANNITGFHVRRDGRLRPLSGSTRPLSADAVQPAQVQFNKTGDFIAVTEKATNRIDLYSVEDGVAQGPFVNASNGVTPFGFAFDRRDRLLVSEAFADAPGQSALSSYDFDDADSPLEVISGTVRAGQTSACWVAVTKNGRYSFVANTGSGTISTYRVARDGELSVVGNGVSAQTGSGSAPQDLALSRGNRFLFVLTPGTGSVQSFKVHDDGSLRAAATAPGVPASAQGLVAR
jgi:6-phosphogluconolactonase